MAAGLLTEAALAKAIVRRPLVAKIVGDDVWERAVRRGWTSLGLEPFQSDEGNRSVKIARALRRMSLRAVDHVIAPSAYTADLVRRWTPHAPPTTVIYNAAPPPPGAIPDPLPGVAHPRLVMAGRLIPLKRIDGVICMLRDLPGATLVVIGEGEERRALAALAVAEGVAGRVHFTGSLPQAAVLHMLRHSDLVVLNSSTENCPHVLLEALAAGRPVVATRVGGVPELVEDGITGWLADPDKPAELSAHIRRALDDGEWRSRAGVAAGAAAARFAWPAHADAVDRLLRSLTVH